MIEIKTFYKVLVISVDVFESSIIDERHFGTKEDARQFVLNHNKEGLVYLIIRM